MTDSDAQKGEQSLSSLALDPELLAEELAAEEEAQAEYEISELFDDIGGAASDDDDAPAAEETPEEE